VTHRPGVTQKPLQKCDNTIYVPVLFNEPQTLAPRQVSNNIEGKVLQPLAEVATVSRFCIQLLRLIEKDTNGRAYKRFVVDKRAHSKGIIDAATVLRVVVFIDSGKERLEAATICYGILDGIKVGL
jgi:hypothetical protein